MATTLDYQTALAAARNWLNINEGFASGMIGDDILMAAVKAALDAVDKERAKTAVILSKSHPIANTSANTVHK